MDFPGAILLVLMLLLLLPLLWVLLTLNGFRRLGGKLLSSLAEVESGLGKRHELAPGLAAVVRSYAAHETEVIEGVAVALERAREEGAGWEAEQYLHGRIERLLVQAETYPNLLASDRFRVFQEGLAGCAAGISSAKRAYEVAVLDYNSSLETFPASVVARVFGFRPKPDFRTAIVCRGNPGGGGRGAGGSDVSCKNRADGRK